jgi:hypothetical protein
MTWDVEQDSPATRGTSSKIDNLATERTPVTAGTPTIAGTPSERRDVNNARTPETACRDDRNVGNQEQRDVNIVGVGSNSRGTDHSRDINCSKYIVKNSVDRSTGNKIVHERTLGTQTSLADGLSTTVRTPAQNISSNCRHHINSWDKRNVDSSNNIGAASESKAAADDTVTSRTASSVLMLAGHQQQQLFKFVRKSRGLKCRLFTT